MEQLFVTKDVNYAASKASATQETADSPELLADGAIGVYGIHRHGTAGKRSSLITLNTTGEAGNVYTVADQTFNGDQIFFAVGTPDGCYIGPFIDIEGLKRVEAKEYSAPVMPTFVVGYNSTDDGDLNTPTTINKNDTFTIKVTDISETPSSPNEEHFTVALKGGETDYEVAVAAVEAIAKIASHNSYYIVNYLSGLAINTDTAGSAFANTATATATNGSTAVSTSAAHGVGQNDFIKLGGDVYKAVAVASQTITLDSPYRGATGVVANANARDLGATTPAKVGISISGKDPSYPYSVAVEGILEGVDVRKTVDGDIGVGSAAVLSKLEKAVKGKLGSNDAITSYMKFPESRIDPTKNYDVYQVDYRNIAQPSGDAHKVHQVNNRLTLAFPNDGAAAPANGVQSTFEIVMETLYPATVGILS